MGHVRPTRSGLPTPLGSGGRPQGLRWFHDMALIVQKFGGTSVGSIERIQQVADKIKKFREQGDDVVVVVSAMSGETNRLIDLAKQITDGRPVPRELDMMVSTGEQVTIALLAMALDRKSTRLNSSHVRISYAV